MNKRVIDGDIDNAYRILAKRKIASGGKVSNKYRKQISSFGAAITMGSVLSAIAYFSEKANSETYRPRIIAAVYDIIKERKENKDKRFPESLFDYAKEEKKRGRYSEESCKEDILNAAIALKLAMNLYELVDTPKSSQKN